MLSTIIAFISGFVTGFIFIGVFLYSYFFKKNNSTDISFDNRIGKRVLEEDIYWSDKNGYFSLDRFGEIKIISGKYNNSRNYIWLIVSADGEESWFQSRFLISHKLRYSSKDRFEKQARFYKELEAKDKLLKKIEDEVEQTMAISFSKVK